MTIEEKASKKVKRMLKSSPYFWNTTLDNLRISKAYMNTLDTVNVIIFDCARTQDGHYSNIFDTIMTYTCTEFLDACRRKLYEQIEAIIGRDHIDEIARGRVFDYFYFDGVPYRKKTVLCSKNLNDVDFKLIHRLIRSISGVNLITGEEEIIFDESSEFQPYKTPAMQTRFKPHWDKMDILIDVLMNVMNKEK